MNDRFEKIAIIAKYFIERYPAMSGQSQMTIEQEGASPLSLIMDIECVDKMHNLDLDRMLEDLDSFHVQHDVIGIWRNLDRKTKKLRDCWLPRFGQDWEETQDAQHWEHDKSLIQDDNGKIIGRRRGLHSEDNWLD
jgi:hypothetical protein